jgi:hypothetical protein
MRKIRQRQVLGATRTKKRIALAVGTLSVLAASVSFSALASGRVTTHNQSAKVAAAETPAAYSGGVLMAADPAGGYWTTSWLGTVTSHNGAAVFGSPAASGLQLTKPIMGMASTPDGQGYWLVASDGGVFAYGDAQFYGSSGAIRLNQPVVGMAATPDGKGYWLVASDGGVFAYGDAQFYGSTGAIHLNKAILGMAPTPDGQGYWLVASDGGIFTYGDAAFYGSLGGGTESVLGLVVSPPTAGYTLVTGNGGASTFPAQPSASPPATPFPSGLGVGVTTLTTPVPTPPSPAALASDCQPTTPPIAQPDQSLDSLITNETGPGWIGGDATYSTQLPNGSDAFVFSDTLIGSAQASGLANLTGFLHSSELVGSLSGLRTNTGGTSSAPQTLIPDTTNPSDTWQVAGTDVENGQQLVFVNEFTPVAGSIFDSFTGQSGIAVLSIPLNGMPVYKSITLLPPDSFTEWGNAVMESGDYNYIFGNYSTVPGTFMDMKVARVPVGQSLNTSAWQYWNGAQWVSGESNAAPMATTNQLTGVTTQPDGGGYIGVSTTPSTAATSVELSYACSPTGPWTAPQPVYSIPQVRLFNNVMAYIPTFHNELSSNGNLVVSYNINSLTGLSALEQNVHQYQPSFLQLAMGGS